MEHVKFHSYKNWDTDCFEFTLRIKNILPKNGARKRLISSPPFPVDGRGSCECTLQVEIDQLRKLIMCLLKISNITSTSLRCMGNMSISNPYDRVLNEEAFEKNISACEYGMIKWNVDIDLADMIKKFSRLDDTTYSYIRVSLTAMAKGQCPIVDGMPSRLAPNESRRKFLGDISRMLVSECFSDVNVIIGSKKIAAHKVVLAARSNKLAQILRQSCSKNSPDSKPQLDMSEFNLKAVYSFLKFLYTSEVLYHDVPNTVELMRIASKYGIEELRDLCSSYLKFHVDNKNATDLLLLARHCDDKNLKRFVMNFVRENGADVDLEDKKMLLKENPDLMIEMVKALAAM